MNKEIQSYQKRINNVVCSGIPNSSQIEICKAIWKEYNDSIKSTKKKTKKK